MPFCSSFEFVHQDTQTRGWDNDDLQRAYCDAAACGTLGPTHGCSAMRTGGNGTVIKGAAVFSHSMGNLIFAAALQNKLCTLDSSADWYSANAPWLGSEAVPWLINICNGSWYEKPLQWLAEELTFCEGNKTSRAYMSLAPGYPGLVGLQKVAKDQLSGQMCGSSALGLGSEYSAPLEALSVAVGYPGPNDGMVTTSSCFLPGITYSQNYSAKYYVSTTNHADGCCRNGNGYFGDDQRRPCGWYKARGGGPD